MSVSRHPVRDADLLPTIPVSTPKHAGSGNFLWHMDHASPAYSDFSARGRDRSPNPSGSFKTPDGRHRTAHIPGHTPHHYYGYGHHPYHSPYGHRSWDGHPRYMPEEASSRRLVDLFVLAVGPCWIYGWRVHAQALFPVGSCNTGEIMNIRPSKPVTNTCHSI